ncbi:hypothetical protein V8D89_003895 [Ganoderma adspersum]
MFIFNGKFDWFQAASNEMITIVFPAGFALNDPVSAYWQWTTDAHIHRKASVCSSGVVNSVTAASDDYSRIHFSFGYYTFDATVTTDYKTLTLKICGQGGSFAGPFELAAAYINPANIRSTVVYTGTLEWLSYAKGEMTTLVVPYGVAEGAFFGLYHQWTISAYGVKKANVRVNGVFQDVKYGADGRITASFKAQYYTYSFTFSGRDGSFVLSESESNPNRAKSQSQDNKFALAYSL